MKLSDITIYSMHRPLGCGADPWFGWKIESDQPDTLQEACQITVADEAGQILWDTGRVASRLPSLSGKPLTKPHPLSGHGKRMGQPRPGGLPLLRF